MKVWIVAEAWGYPGCTGSDIETVWFEREAAEASVRDKGGTVGETHYVTEHTLQPEGFVDPMTQMILDRIDIAESNIDANLSNVTRDDY